MAREYNYTFEELQEGGYQVRLKGEFVMYTPNNSSVEVDSYLESRGYSSREEFFEESVNRHLQSLNVPKQI